MMKKYNVAILGASGAVGKEILHQLEITHFPINHLLCLASKKSSGQTLIFNQQPLFVEEATSTSFQNIDLVFGAVTSELSAYFAPFIQEAHALYIDNSSYFRNKENIPLIIPEINALDCLNHQGIIANPNCSTIIILSALYAIHCCSPIQSLIVSTYQAVSGAGLKGIEELNVQMKDSSNPIPHVFDYPIAFNVIPFIGKQLSNGFSDEEEKLKQESRKILHLPKLLVSCTCVRVPVIRCHSMSITCTTLQDISLETIQHEFNNHPQCLYCEHTLPMPYNSSDQDIITVGRLRKNDLGISLWCCGDQLRKGAATNAVQIAHYCHEKNLI